MVTSYAKITALRGHGLPPALNGHGQPDGSGLSMSGSCGYADPKRVVVVPASAVSKLGIRLSAFVGAPGAHTVRIEPAGMPAVEASFELQ